MTYRYSEKRDGKCKRCSRYIGPESDLCESCLAYNIFGRVEV